MGRVSLIASLLLVSFAVVQCADIPGNSGIGQGPQCEPCVCLDAGPAARKTPPGTFTVTCDNECLEIYVDGEKQPFVTNYRDWRKADTLSIKAGASVIAVKAKDWSGGGATSKYAGILLSTTNGFYTDEKWKCSPIYEDGWETTDFNDDHWRNARSTGDYTESPRGTQFPGMHTDSKYIWTASAYGNQPVVYCRGRIAPPPKPETPAGTFTATCDNECLEIYVNGEKQPTIANDKDWRIVGSGNIKAGASVIAVKARDYNGGGSTSKYAGILLSTSTGFYTDERWKCSPIYEYGWETTDFNDKHWKNARSTGHKTQSPRGILRPDMNNIHADSKYIWTVTAYGNQPIVYCRGRIA